MKVLGFLLCAAGVILGVYVGFWWAFVGGIMTLINEVKASDPSATAVGYAILRIMLASMLGWAAAAVPFFIGVFFLQND